MTKDLILVQELLRAKMINAKREKEAAKIVMDGADCVLTETTIFHHWEGQEIAFRQMLDIVTKVVGE